MLKLNRIYLQLFAEEEKENTPPADPQGQEPTNTPEGGEVQEPEKKYTQADIDSAVQKRLAREKGKAEKEFKNSDDYKAFSEWKESQKTEQEKYTELETGYNDLMAQNQDLHSQLQSYKNKDTLRGKGVKDDFVGFVGYEVQKLVSEDKDFDTALGEYLEKNPQYANTEKPSGFQAGRRQKGNPKAESGLADEMLKKFYGDPKGDK